MKTDDRRKHHHYFIHHLQTLAQGRADGKDDKQKHGNSAAIAALKRSLQEETRSQIAAYPYVVPHLSKEYRGNDWAYFLVAGLFALHPEHSTEHPSKNSKAISNMGTTCRLLGSEDDNPSATWVLRFKALLDAEKEDVAHHLRSIISMAASQKKPVNYVQLLSDLCNWSHRERFVQSNMAREFWQLPASQKTPENEDAAA